TRSRTSTASSGTLSATCAAGATAACSSAGSPPGSGRAVAASAGCAVTVISPPSSARWIAWPWTAERRSRRNRHPSRRSPAFNSERDIPEVPSSVLDTVDYPGSREPTKVRRANEREESEQETPSRAAASLKRIPGNHNRPSGQEEVSQVYDRSHAGSSGILLEPKNYCEQRSE